MLEIGETMKDPDDVWPWLAMLALAMLAALGLAGLTWLIIDAIHESNSKDGCSEHGGIIEHYDKEHHPGYWRCRHDAEVPR